LIQISSESVTSGSDVDIQVSLDNHNALTALQFDITFEPSLFAEIDTSKCTSRLSGGPYLAACRRQDPPNDDVIRYVVVRTDLRPIESGILGNLTFQSAANAPSMVSPIGALECTGLGVSESGKTIPLAAFDFEAGEIVPRISA